MLVNAYTLGSKGVFECAHQILGEWAERSESHLILPCSLSFTLPRLTLCQPCLFLRQQSIILTHIVCLPRLTSSVSLCFYMVNKVYYSNL